MDMLVITRGCCWSFLQVVWSLILHHGGIARLKPMSRSGFDEPWWGTEFRILGNERWTLDWSLLDDYWIITGWLLDHYWMIIGWWWWGWWWLWLFFLLLFLFIPHYDGDDDDNYYCPHILPKCWIHFSCHSLLVQVCPDDTHGASGYTGWASEPVLGRTGAVPEGNGDVFFWVRLDSVEISGDSDSDSMDEHGWTMRWRWTTSSCAMGRIKHQKLGLRVKRMALASLGLALW